MNIKHNNKDYILNVKRAIELGVLKEPQVFKVELNGDELAALMKVTNHVGGNPKGIRGAIDTFRVKIKDLPYSTNKNLNVRFDGSGIFFVEWIWDWFSFRYTVVFNYEDWASTLRLFEVCNDWG